MIEEHPRIGVNILAGADLPPEILAIVGNHHERLNGKGYPSKLTADETVILTITTAALPAAGTLIVDLYFTQT